MYIALYVYMALIFSYSGSYFLLSPFHSRLENEGIVEKISH